MNKNTIIIKGLNKKNFKDIPQMGKFDCQECMWFQKEKASVERKEKFLNELEKLHGSCAKILYINDMAVGYCYYCPKKYLIRLEDYKKGSTNTDAWFIACLAIKEEFRGRGLATMLLKKVIADLKKRGIKKVQARGIISGNDRSFPSGYWSIYGKLGFKEIGGADNVKVGELILNS